MLENFKYRYSTALEDTLNIGHLISEGNLTNDEVQRLSKIRDSWNFYEGYHWEGMDDLDKPQVTFNYCRTFVNKFVSFEMGRGFNISTPIALKQLGVTKDTKPVLFADKNGDGYVDEQELKSQEVINVEKNIYDFLTGVWKENDVEQFSIEFGQTKSVTGEAWVKVQYIHPDDLDDPFEEYPDGRIRVNVVPTQYVFPTFNQHDKDKLDEILIMYPIEKRADTGILFKRERVETVIYKELWTRETIKVYEGKELVDEMENPYGLIPFVQTKNFPVAGRTRGVSDLDDIIPLNVELNTKRSDISEIIDYHSAPITLVYGARIGNLEKGANKVWGGLPKDSKVENLHLQGDLVASTQYLETLKTSMCEIGAVPETVLGGASAISNTSGVALEYMNLPLIDRTRVKRQSTIKGLQLVNKIILFIAVQEGLIEVPEGVSMKDFLYNEVTIPDNLPKDKLIELQQIEQEMRLGLECRHGAMTRLNKDNIEETIKEIDEERSKHPELFNPQILNYMQMQTGEINSGMMNGQTAIEQTRKEITGQNGPQRNTPQP